MDNESDPLPFIRLERSTAALAARLADALGIMSTHGMGVLIGLWQMCGEPRVIERLIEDGKEAVLLSAVDVVSMIQILSAKTCTADQLVLIGVLSRTDEDGLYRVRGMSRFFEVIKNRLTARESGRTGGQRSADARRSKPSTPPQAESNQSVELRAKSKDQTTTATDSEEPPKKRSRATRSTWVPKPVQETLPTLPDPPEPLRAASTSEQAYARYQANRRFQLVKILEVPFEDDAPMHPAAINTGFKKIATALEALKAKFPAADSELRPLDEQLFDKWFDNAWGAGLSPPFPFQAFLSEKVWRRHLGELEQELAEDGPEEVLAS